MFSEMPQILIFALLTLVTLLSHFWFLSIGLGFTDPDVAWICMDSDRFHHFYLDFPPFFHTVWYGGNAFSWFRALWTALYSLFPISVYGHSAYQSGHLTFTYLVTPLFVTFATYYLLSHLFRLLPALLMSLVAAVGINHFLIRYGFDWHVGSYIFACLFFAWKTKYPNAFFKSSTRELLFFAFLSGLAIYNGRNTLICVFLFWLPLEETYAWLKNQWKQGLQNRFEKISFYSAVFLIGLFFYLEIFGSNLGTIYGKPLKLQSQPNAQYAFILIVIILLRRNLNFLVNNTLILKRFGLATFAFLVGFLPEIIYSFKEGHIPDSGTWGSNDFEGFFKLFGYLPRAFSELIAGQDLQLLRQPSVLLAVFGIVAIFWGALIKDARLRPIAIYLVICFYSFCRVWTFTPGAVRYLFMIFPAIIAGSAFFTQIILDKNKKFLTAILAFLLIGQVTFQIKQRIEMTQNPKISENLDFMRQVNAVFTRENLDTILTNDYDEGNTYSFAADKKLAYLNPGRVHPLYVAEKYRLAETGETKEIGLLISLRYQMVNENMTQIDFNSKQWKIKFLEKVGNFYLFRAKL